MSQENIQIREAKADDCEAISGLIQELADAVEMSNRPCLDADSIRNHGFGEERLFKCLLATDTTPSGDENIIGYVMYYFMFSTWRGVSGRIEDLYVKPTHRNLGIGTKLLKDVAKVAVKRGCSRLDWMAVTGKSHAMDFFKSRGARDVTENESWHLFRLSDQSLLEFALFDLHTHS